ncbi:RNA polymerase sigma factor SigM [Nocardiopsis dassonvillei]|uniref:RNA polymerase, sigma-24 subunit, ECF subfamily n=1 Tax=Nocardiopsis dassonvillei (strain ATCC 23218 / DSM 43111 / CIP 107115 / JCM 7437 / KCTC 9190 / NBRC 14626 / NCTC 10488 / NRRL B-5397 / IMRU 509) TaxID=446468 RepID=D7B309_NOCDD|nr:RNA polymerase, sigma-24 subunit, ECF subfamily [Nocardiopsis dassonvillei subsp. dassonvillei DSM 43111]VEI89208.1 RNA polymerase sigma factor SigM [Nocardiopsis dassonvillei]
MPDQSHEDIHDTQAPPQTVLSTFSGEEAPPPLPVPATTGGDTAGPNPDGNPGETDAAAPSDAELVRAACRGEHRAWEAIVDRHLPVVNAIARSYRLSVPDREDAVQTVWLTLNQQLPRLHSPERLRGWLRRVAHDACGRQRRHSARDQPVDPRSLTRRDPLSEDSGPEAQYLRKEEHEELHRAIRRLTDPGERRAALRYLDGAAGLPVPPAPCDPGSSDDQVHPRTAANQRRRMLRRLRRLLEEPT